MVKGYGYYYQPQNEEDLVSISWSSPITGQPQTGLTNPTYTTITDTAPPGNPGKQVAVSALGGTQAGVNVHSVCHPVYP